MAFIDGRSSFLGHYLQPSALPLSYRGMLRETRDPYLKVREMKVLLASWLRNTCCASSTSYNRMRHRQFSAENCREGEQHSPCARIRHYVNPSRRILLLFQGCHDAINITQKKKEKEKITHRQKSDSSTKDHESCDDSRAVDLHTRCFLNTIYAAFCSRIPWSCSMLRCLMRSP